ncbi:MAG: DUF1835 domain-containing protein [Acidobacteria bacterium]|nr:DUF1835 domain-containing protein [Acidobacteriota bacterium]
MVHITNGDAVADELRRWAGEPRLIVWHDILHEGPVPAGLSLEQLTAVRGEWLAANGYGASDKLRERDRQLRRLVQRDSVWLWFEDDLYDQLQLLQLLHFLHEEGLTLSPHFIVDIPRTLEVEQMAGLAAAKTKVTPEMFDTAGRAWQAFTAPNRVEAIHALLRTNLDALPNLRPAMERLLEHTPENNRVQRTILELLKDGGKTAHQLFVEYQNTEERPFLGDTVFLHYLDALSPRVVKDHTAIYRLS